MPSVEQQAAKMISLINRQIDRNFHPGRGAQVAVIKRVEGSFDQDAGEFVIASETETPIYVVPQRWSDFLKASTGVEGKVFVWARTDQIPFTPRTDESDGQADEIFFGDWTTTGQATAETATASGVVTAVDKEARYAHQQLLWGLTVDVRGAN